MGRLQVQQSSTTNVQHLYLFVWLSFVDNRQPLGLAYLSSSLSHSWTPAAAHKTTCKLTIHTSQKTSHTDKCNGAEVKEVKSFPSHRHSQGKDDLHCCCCSPWIWEGVLESFATQCTVPTQMNG